MLTHIVTKVMNMLQEVYSWTVLICLSMPKQNVYVCKETWIFSNFKCCKVQLCFDYKNHDYKVYSWIASWTVLVCLCLSKIFVAFVRLFSLSQFTFKSFCENSNSRNCHIGMASFHHELLVSVLRKTMRFYSFMFFMCFDINLKTVFKSVQLSKGAFIINDFLRNPLEQNYFEDGDQSLQNSIHNPRIRCYTTSVPIPMILVNSTLTI